MMLRMVPTTMCGACVPPCKNYTLATCAPVPKGREGGMGTGLPGGKKCMDASAAPC